jgi:hypothetical protein
MARSRLAHLERQADEEEFLPEKPVEATQLLHRAHTVAQPDRMGRPPPLGRITHSDQISRKQRDAAVNQPLRAVGRNEGTVLDPSWRSPLLVAAGPADHRRDVADGAPGFQLCRLEIADRDRLAVAPVRQIEQMARKNELLERQARCWHGHSPLNIGGSADLVVQSKPHAKGGEIPCRLRLIARRGEMLGKHPILVHRPGKSP